MIKSARKMVSGEPMDKIRALIVDDSSVMRKIVERCLRPAGIRQPFTPDQVKEHVLPGLGKKT
jgi:hypothetical protein